MSGKQKNNGQDFVQYAVKIGYSRELAEVGLTFLSLKLLKLYLASPNWPLIPADSGTKARPQRIHEQPSSLRPSVVYGEEEASEWLP